MEPKPVTSAPKLTLDYRVLTVVLVLVIVGMLALWRPWQDPHGNDRTIEVTGTAKVTATPDEFLFYPSYQFKNADKQAAIAAMTQKSNEIVTKLKQLGVQDSKIKTNSSGYDLPVYNDDKNTPTYTLSLTVTIGDKDLAQKSAGLFGYDIAKRRRITTGQL